MEYQYLVQLKGNGIESMRLLTIKNLFKLANLEIYFVCFGSDPRRMRYGFDGTTLYIYDRYGNVFDKYSKN